jgi:hypothetical protein
MYFIAAIHITKHTRFVAALLGLRHTAHLKLGVRGVGYALTLAAIAPY